MGLQESPRLRGRGGSPVSAVTRGIETLFEESKNMDESGNNRTEDFMSHRELEGRRNGDINQEKRATEKGRQNGFQQQQKQALFGLRFFWPQR